MTKEMREDQKEKRKRGLRTEGRKVRSSWRREKKEERHKRLRKLSHLLCPAKMKLTNT